LVKKTLIGKRGIREFIEAAYDEDNLAMRTPLGMLHFKGVPA